MALSPKHFYELMNLKFIIPPYQRGYRWDKEQVEDLLNDFEEFIKSIANCDDKESIYYCLQPITVVPKEGGSNEYYVIDGQQRLTTIYLLLQYLIQGSRMKNMNIFSLSMPSRKIQDEYINKNKFLTSETIFETNIDNFYIHKAYETIENWFDEKSIRHFEEQDFLKILMSPPLGNNANKHNDVRIIWYEITNATALQAFRRLNYGKIPLTSSELVKALLLQTDNYKNGNSIQQTTSSTRAVEWDNMEHTLQNPYLWSMLSKADDNNDSSSRMELILDFVADTLNREMHNSDGKVPFMRKDEKLLKSSKDSRDYFDYHVINKYLHDNNNHESIENVWSRICDTFNLITNWYDDRRWYHLIGLIRILQDKNRQRSRHDFVSYIYKLSTNKDGQPLNRPDFTAKLKEVIGNSLRLNNTNLNSLKYYDNPKEIIKILESLNVMTAMKDDTECCRFPFYLFDYYNITSLEHIHPQNITKDMSYKEFVNWFKNRTEDINNLSDNDWQNAINNQERQEKEETEETKDIYILKQKVNDAIKSIEAIVSDKTKFNDEVNQKVLDDASTTIDKLFGDLSGISEEELHSISNMALVDNPTNSALQNFFLNKKREILMQRHSRCIKFSYGKIIDNDDNKTDGTYAMPATRKVFCKDYSREDPGDMRLWRREDRNNYMKAIEETYNYFVTNDKQ